MTMAAGMYGLTLEKFLIVGNAASYTNGLESTTLNKTMLVQDAYTPNFDTNAFRSSVTNEPANSGSYTSGGSVLTGTLVTPASPVATQLKYSASDPAPWTATTITAQGAVTYRNVGTAATDELIVANVFSGPVSTSGGSFTLSWHTNGLFFIDYA